MEGIMSMNEKKERVKAKILARWLDDLRNNRQPEVLADISSLDDSDIEEILGLARGMKAVMFPSSLGDNEISEIRDIIMAKIANEQEQQMHERTLAVQQAKDFGHLVSSLIDKLGVDKNELVSELGIHEEVLIDIETGKTPPIRLPIDVMLVLLNRLGIATKSILDLIRHSTLDWIAGTYSASETQLARIDFTVKDWERRLFLEKSKVEGEELTKELQRLAKYLNKLEQGLT
jgi:DNA-directed RNA polymerase subunit F